jgi:hypothetical protein
LKRQRLIPWCVATALCVAIPGGPASAETGGWGGAAWGMTVEQLDRTFGDELVRLDTALDFGPLYADRILPEVELAGYRFRAFLQMDRETGTLAQVLLEIRRLDAPAVVAIETVETLTARYGPPTCIEEVVLADGLVVPVAASWSQPDTTIQAGLIDMNRPDILTEDPNIRRDVRRSQRERFVIRRSALPRRVTVRFHPAARTDLDLAPCAGAPTIRD